MREPPLPYSKSVHCVYHKCRKSQSCSRLLEPWTKSLSLSGKSLKYYVLLSVCLSAVLNAFRHYIMSVGIRIKLRLVCITLFRFACSSKLKEICSCKLTRTKRWCLWKTHVKTEWNLNVQYIKKEGRIYLVFRERTSLSPPSSNWCIAAFLFWGEYVRTAWRSRYSLWNKSVARHLTRVPNSRLSVVSSRSLLMTGAETASDKNFFKERKTQLKSKYLCWSSWFACS